METGSRQVLGRYLGTRQDNSGGYFSGIQQEVHSSKQLQVLHRIAEGSTQEYSYSF